MAQQDSESLEAAAVRIFGIKDVKDRNAELAEAALNETDKAAAFDYLSKRIEELEKAGKEAGPADIAGQWGTGKGQTQVNASMPFDATGPAGGTLQALHGWHQDEKGSLVMQNATGASVSLNADGSPTQVSVINRTLSKVWGDEDVKHLVAVEKGLGVKGLDGEKAELQSNTTVLDVAWLPTGSAKGLTFINGVAVDDLTGNTDVIHEIAKNMSAPDVGDVSAGVFATYNVVDADRGLHTPDNLTVGGEVRKTWEVDKTSDITAALQGSYNENAGGAGMLSFRYDFGKTPKPESAADKPAVQALEAPPDILTQAQPEPATETQVNSATDTAAPTSITTAPATQTDNAYDFLGLSKKDQQKLLTMMAENYQSTHSNVSIQDAKDVIIEQLQLTKTNYFVNSQGTQSQADDMPLIQGQVATM